MTRFKESELERISVQSQPNIELNSPVVKERFLRSVVLGSNSIRNRFLLFVAYLVLKFLSFRCVLTNLKKNI